MTILRILKREEEHSDYYQNLNLLLFELKLKNQRTNGLNYFTKRLCKYFLDFCDLADLLCFWS
jgi:hypothetical protein